ncbi:ABC transporter substrate-binding protein [Phytohabitans kaempferiae]|uniref:ABC transporter substrate-binding protein n=1 Tax=Phytohabitans kaempferiae TaxID=1620943 RepID=A0ABV6M7M8_9ACTN
MALSVVAACGTGDDPPEGAARSGELSKSVVKVLGTPQAYDAPVLLAQELGYFDEVGLSVTFDTSAGGADLLPALLGRSADFVLPSVSVPLNAATEGAPVRVVATLGHATELQMVIRADVAKAKNIPTDDADAQLKALRGSGLRIAVSAPGGGVYTQTQGLLEARGLTVDRDVTLVPHPTPDAELAAFNNNQVDAFVWVPAAIFAVDDADVVRVRYAQLPEYQGMDFITLVTTSQVTQTNPDTVRAFLTGLAKGWQYTLDNPDEAKRLVGKKFFPQLAPEVLDKVFQSAYDNLGPTFALTRGGFDKGVALANLGRPQPIDVSYENFVDNTFANEAIKTLGLDVPTGD